MTRDLILLHPTPSERIAEPYDKLAGMGRAWVLARLGRTAEARTANAEAREIADTFKFETFRASLSLVEGMIDEAEGDLEAAVANYSSAAEKAVQVSPVYRIRLARALTALKRYDEAIENLESAQRLQPGHPELHLELARALHGKGDDDRARESLAKALAGWSEADAGFPALLSAQELERSLRGDVQGSAG